MMFESVAGVAGWTVRMAAAVVLAWAFGTTTPAHAAELPVGTPAAATNAPAACIATNAVRPEAWTEDFPTALARARAEHRPLLVSGGATKCGGCIRMRKDMEEKVFKYWVKGTGIYLARFFIDKVDASPE